MQPVAYIDEFRQRKQAVQHQALLVLEESRRLNAEALERAVYAIGEGILHAPYDTLDVWVEVFDMACEDCIRAGGQPSPSPKVLGKILAYEEAERNAKRQRAADIVAVVMGKEG